MKSSQANKIIEQKVVLIEQIFSGIYSSSIVIKGGRTKLAIFLIVY